jgi:hypothetical protein
VSIIAIGGGSPMRQQSFGSVASAKKWAKTEANRTGVSTVIYNKSKSGRTSTHHVKPDKKGNPVPPSLPRNKWVNAKVMVTTGGKIKAKISGSALKKPNPRRRKYYEKDYTTGQSHWVTRPIPSELPGYKKPSRKKPAKKKSNSRRRRR